MFINNDGRLRARRSIIDDDVGNDINSPAKVNRERVTDISLGGFLSRTIEFQWCRRVFTAPRKTNSDIADEGVFMRSFDY